LKKCEGEGKNFRERDQTMERKKTPNTKRGEVQKIQRDRKAAGARQAHRKKEKKGKKKEAVREKKLVLREKLRRPLENKWE